MRLGLATAIGFTSRDAVVGQLDRGVQCRLLSQDGLPRPNLDSEGRLMAFGGTGPRTQGDLVREAQAPLDGDRATPVPPTSWCRSLVMISLSAPRWGDDNAATRYGDKFFAECRKGLEGLRDFGWEGRKTSLAVGTDSLPRVGREAELGAIAT